MDPQIARQWAEDFESKSISELKAYRVPSGFPGHFVSRWQKARLAAIAAREAPLNDARQTLVQQIAARAGQLAAAENPQSVAFSGTPEAPVIADDDAEERFEEVAAQGESADIETEAFDPSAMTQEEKVENLRERLAAAIARNNETPLVEEQIIAKGPAPLVPPQGDAITILERQLGSGAAMVDEIARYLIQQDCSVGAATDFMRGVSLVMSASASVGKVVNQLRGGGVARTQHLITVEHVQVGGRGSQTLQTNGA